MLISDGPTRSTILKTTTDAQSKLSPADPKQLDDGWVAWAWDASRCVVPFGAAYAGSDKAKGLVDCFGCWMQERRPDANGLVNFDVIAPHHVARN